MPKKTTKKNTKGTKNTTSKKVEAKTTPVKNVETKVTEKVEVKKVKKEKKGKAKAVVTKVMENTPFVISLCAIVLLVAALILALCTKRVPTTSKGEEILATVNGKTITADELYLSLKDSHGTDALINLIDTYIADKEVKITEENKKYVQEVVDYYKEYAEIL